jgi:hypothetical protein
MSCSHEGFLGLYRRAIPDRGMNSFAIVISLNPVHDIEPGVIPGFIAQLVDPLDLEGLEEALHWRIVPGVGQQALRNA